MIDLDTPDTRRALPEPASALDAPQRVRWPSMKGAPESLQRRVRALPRSLRPDEAELYEGLDKAH